MINLCELNRIESVSKYVCAFWQAKKLYELGVPQQSMFKHVLEKKLKNHNINAVLEDVYMIKADDISDEESEKKYGINDGFFGRRELYAAFTLQELHELIDEYLKNSGIIIDNLNEKHKDTPMHNADVLIELLENFKSWSYYKNV
jgi:hypothetical protein